MSEKNYLEVETKILKTLDKAMSDGIGIETETNKQLNLFPELSGKVNTMYVCSDLHHRTIKIYAEGVKPNGEQQRLIIKPSNPELEGDKYIKVSGELRYKDLVRLVENFDLFFGE